MSGTLHNKRNAFRSFRTFGATSRYFNGVDDVVELGQTSDNAIFTASTWVKLNAHDATYGEGVFGKWQIASNGSWLIYVDAINIRFIVRNGANGAHTIVDSGISASSIIGNWTHIAGVADGTNLTVYVNGVSEGSIAYDGTINNPTTAIAIGAYNHTINSNHLTDGNIADCRLYDEALTPTQVSDLYNGLDLRNNLVGQWLINADDTVDHSTNSNNGKNIGQSFYSLDGPLPNNELFGKYSRAFSGISEYIDCGNAVPLFPNLPYTVSTWVKVDPTFNDVGVICARGRNIATNGAYTRELFLFTHDTGNGQSTFAAQRGKNGGPYETVNTTNTFTKGVWYHVCATYDGSNLKIFVDGVSEGTIISTVAVPTTDKFYIAKSLGLVDYKINGNVADIRVYDSALTTAQISDLYNGTDVQTGLIGHWLRNTDDLLDYSSNNNHGAEGEIGSVFDINDGPKYR